MFAENVRGLVRQLPETIANHEDVKPLVRASGSIAINCIEANEARGNDDRIMKFRISRKEAKQAQLWLRLLDVGTDDECADLRDTLRQEAHELMLIYTSIIKKLE